MPTVPVTGFVFPLWFRIAGPALAVGIVIAFAVNPSGAAGMFPQVHGAPRRILLAVLVAFFAFFIGLWATAPFFRITVTDATIDNSWFGWTYSSLRLADIRGIVRCHRMHKAHGCIALFFRMVHGGKKSISFETKLLPVFSDLARRLGLGIEEDMRWSTLCPGCCAVVLGAECDECGWTRSKRRTGAPRKPEPSVVVPDVVCPECGESVPGNFEACWNCGGGIR